MTVHREGKNHLLIVSLILLTMGISTYILRESLLLEFSMLTALMLILLLFFLYFFRKPRRVPETSNQNVIFSPCDGKIVLIEEVEETEYMKCKCLQIAVFMSPFNVHINWYPIGGRIKYYKYHPGKHLVAWHPKSSTKNERTTTVIDTGQEEILVRQIAGTVARRIVCYTKPDTQVKQNSELGFIKFGSRMDIFLPLSAKPSVSIGQDVIGTQTILATMR